VRKFAIRLVSAWEGGSRIEKAEETGFFCLMSRRKSDDIEWKR
jgi:hypothetical protein